MSSSFISDRKPDGKSGRKGLTKGMMGVAIISSIILSLVFLGFFLITFVFPVVADLDAGNAVFVSPTNKSFNKGTITLNVSSSTDIINASFYFTNGTDRSTLRKFYLGINTSCDNTNKYCTLSWNTATTPTDIYNVTVDVTNSSWIYNITVTNNFTIDNTAPYLDNTLPVNATYINGTSTQTFQVDVTDISMNTSNVSLSWRICTDPSTCGGWTTGQVLTCSGSSSPYTCSRTLNLASVEDSKIIQFYFETIDNATNYGSNGTAAAPVMATIDRTPPRYTNNLTSIPSNTQYTPKANYGFSVDWTDPIGSVNKVLFETDMNATLANFTVAASSGSTYIVNFTDIGASTYTYRWLANDTVGNWNSSQTVSYTIAKNTTNPVNVVIYNGTANYTNQNVFTVYGTVARVYANTSYWLGGNVMLYRNDSNVTTAENSTDVILAVGVYNYSASTVGNANYTSNSTGPYYLTVTQANANVQVSPPTSSITYGTNALEYCNATLTFSGTEACKLYRNSVDKTAENNTNVKLGVGTYVFVANISDTTNYTGTSTTSTLTVTQASTTIGLLLNRTAGNLTIASGSYVNASVNATQAESTLTFYVNGVAYNETAVTGSIINISSYSGIPGIQFNLTGFAAASTNYTAATPVTWWLSIEAALPTFSNVVSNVTNNTVFGKYGGVINISAQWYDEFELNKWWIASNNGTGWGNGSVQAFLNANWTNFTIYPSQNSLGNTIQYRIYGNDTSNNVNVTDIWQWTIDNSAPVLNNTTPATVSYITGTSAQPFSVSVYDDTLNTSNVTLRWRETGAPSFTAAALTCSGSSSPYTCSANVDLSGEPNAQALEFYFAASDNSQITGFNGTATVPLTTTIDRVYPRWITNITSPVSSTAYSSGASYQFNMTWTNGGGGIHTVLIENNFTGGATPHNDTVTTHTGSEYYFTITDLAAGTYVWKEYANDTAGNWNTTDQWTYVIAQGTPTMTLRVTPTNSTTYPNSIVATATITAGDPAGKFNISLYRNGTIANSSITTSSVSQSILLGVAAYNYTVFYNGTQNYTSGLVENDTIIAKGNLANYLDVALDSAYADKTIVYNATATAFGRFNSTGADDITLKLFRGTSNVSTTENNTAIGLAAGTYTYTYGIVDATAENWTIGNSSARTLIVSKGVLNIGMTDIPNGVYSVEVVVTPREYNKGDLDVNYTLYRNDTGPVQVSATLGDVPGVDTWTPGAGAYTYVINTTSATFQNFTANTTGVSKSFVISKGPTEVIVYINDTARTTATFNRTQVANVTVVVNITGKTVGLASNISGWVNPTSETPLMNISNLNTKGVYNFTGYFSGDANYSASANTTYITVNDVAYPQWSANATSQSTGVKYVQAASYQFNMTWTDDTAVSKAVFEWNGTTNYTSGTTPAVESTGNEFYITLTDLRAGTYTYRWLANDTSGNWNVSDTFGYTVAQAPSSVRLWINDEENHRTFEQGSVTLNFTGKVNTTYPTTIYLHTNITGWGTDKSNATGLITNTTSSSGFNGTWFNITAYFAGDTNFSASSQIYYLNVTPDITPPTVRVYDYTNGTIKKSGASLTLNVSVSDTGVGLAGGAYCSASVGNAAAAPSITYLSGWCNGTVTVPAGAGVSQGNNTINITISDAYSNMGYNSSYVLWVDNAVPVISVTSPSNGSYVKAYSGNMWINGTVYDIYAMGSGNITTNNTDYTAYTFSGTNDTAFTVRNNTKVSDGYIAVMLYYNDSALNTGNTTVYFYVDNTPPSSATGLTTGYRPANASEQILVTVVDSLKTNDTMILNYKIVTGSAGDAWATATMSGTPGTSTTYSASVDTSSVVVGARVLYYITGRDNATNSITSAIGGSSSSLLGQFNISSAGSIDGYVYRNGTNTVIVGATVSDGTRAAVTNSNGYYLISGVPIGTYTATATATNYTSNSTSSVSVTVGSTTTSNISMVYTATGAADGYIVLTNATTLLQGVSVSTGTNGIDVGHTDSNGYYHISNVPAGTYTVTASKTGYYSNSTASVVVTAGSTTRTNISLIGPENYNYTLPDKATPSFWNAGWHSFSMSPNVFANLGITNYNFTNIFSTITNNYTVVYGFNATSGTWKSFIRDAASNDFYGAESSMSQYYIYTNQTDRVEMIPLYT